MIEERCEEPRISEFAAQVIQHPSEAYYPPGLICAKDATLKFCPTAGDSGSPLMVREDGSLGTGERYYIEGILSFLKSCERFRMEQTNTNTTDPFFSFDSFTESPIAYTKVSCFLPWVAQQFGLYFPAADDEACVKGSGQKPPFNSTHEYDSMCRETAASDVYGDERECIFPFYLGEKLYNSCALYSPVNLAVPLWICPTRNITTKYPGTEINHFTDIDLRETYYVDTEHYYSTCLPKESCIRTERSLSRTVNQIVEGCDYTTCQWQLNPDMNGPLLDEDGNPVQGRSEWVTKWLPFSTCKTDCPGGKYVVLCLMETLNLPISVRGFGIIGGGAVLFSASALAGQTILPLLGETFVIYTFEDLGIWKCQNFTNFVQQQTTKAWEQQPQQLAEEQ